jgi:hypothetical protein
MTDMTDDERPWMPQPRVPDTSASTDISTTAAFAGPDGWANVNRAPHDRVSGVIFKRGANVRLVRYALGGEAVERATPAGVPEYTGTGEADVRWVFSEQSGSQENVLGAHAFRYFQDVELLPGAATEQSSSPEQDTLLYVISGEGRLLHRPSLGSPSFVRPLRPFDAVVIRSKEWFAIANVSDSAPLRLTILGLTPFQTAAGRCP